MKRILETVEGAVEVTGDNLKFRHIKPQPKALNMRDLILASGMSQHDLARKSGVPIGTINRCLCNGSPPRPASLLKIANTLSLPVRVAAEAFKQCKSPKP